MVKRPLTKGANTGLIVEDTREGCQFGGGGDRVTNEGSIGFKEELRWSCFGNP